MANEKTPPVQAVSAEAVGPKVAELTSKFKEQSIPLEVDFKDLIKIADVGRKAVGLSADQSNNEPGNGIAVTGEGKLEVKAGYGIKVGSDGVSSDIHSIFPAGMIMMFSGSTIPSGWAICNGEGGTPNLVDKFILGGTLDSLGGRNSISLSGDKNNKVWTEITDSQTPSINLSISGHRLTVDEMPNHEHTEGLKLFWSDDIDSRYSNGLWQKERGLGTNLGSKATTEGVTLAARTSTAGWGKEHSHGGTAAQASHSHAVSVSAPYYVLVFIIKVDG